jgi:hypothetical protein
MLHNYINAQKQNFITLSTQDRIKIINVIKIPSWERIFSEYIPEYQKYFGILIFKQINGKTFSVQMNDEIKNVSLTITRLFERNLLSESEVISINSYL